MLAIPCRGNHAEEGCSGTGVCSIGTRAKATRTCSQKAGQLKARHQLVTRTFYVTSWRARLHDIAHQFRHALLTSSKATYQECKLALQYLIGLIPIARWLYKRNIATSNRCSLCGGEDGRHHALSVCPMISAAVISRHNVAGTVTLEAIYYSRTEERRVPACSSGTWESGCCCCLTQCNKAHSWQTLHCHNLCHDSSQTSSDNTRAQSLMHC